MTVTTKLIIFVVSFYVCSFVGWVFPILWLLLLALGAFLLLSPTKKTVKPVQYTTQNTQSAVPVQQTDTNEIGRRLHELASTARNEDVREGILQSLSAIQHLHATQQPMTHVPQTQQTAAQPTQVQYTEPIQPIIMSESEIAEQKKRQELKNINTILYVACFLLVGAAALFVGFSPDVPATIKFTALLIVAIAFYASGLVLHKKSVRLKPAAIAFVGTGLALIPFVGLAFYTYVVNDGPLVWWLTSLVGLGGFLFALLQIRAQIMSYLTLAFVFSLATSSVSVMHAPFVWYFLSIIATSTVLMYLGYKKPRWVPRELTLPLEQNAQLATPVAVIGSITLVGTLEVSDYAFITGVVALHYCINALSLSVDRTRLLYWGLGRAFAVVFAMIATYFFTLDWSSVLLTLLIAGFVLHVYSSYEVRHEKSEELWLWLSQIMVLVAVLGWWESAERMSAGLFVLLGLSAHQLYVMKRSEFGSLGIVAIGALPLTLLWRASEFIIDIQYIALIVGILGLMSFVVRASIGRFRHPYSLVASAAYFVLAAESMVLAATSWNQLWFGSITVGVGALLYLSSYVEKKAELHVISNVVLAVGIFFLYADVFGEYTWATLASAWTLGLLWYVLRWYFTFEDKSYLAGKRIEIMTWSSVTILLLGAIVAVFIDETVVAGGLTGCVAAALLVYEGYVRGRTELYEIALYVTTLSLQRLVGFTYPEANFLIYTHWWALTAAIGAALRLQRNDRDGAKVRSILALVALSLPTGLFALDDPNRYQLLFLLEHIVLAVGGLVMNKKLVVQWAAVAIGLAMLWLLKSFTYLLLLVLALALIGFAVWRLMKRS